MYIFIYIFFLFIYWFITIYGMQKQTPTNEMQKSPRPHFEITNGSKMKKKMAEKLLKFEKS